VSNALRHSPRGGAVRLSAKERDNGMEISIQDEGAGIEARHLPRIFDRFYRAEESRSNTGGSPGGSGLGLALVKTIMDLHGGSASVTSAAGQGTTFRLWFPAG
jgi:signal transduction histidine kinase